MKRKHQAVEGLLLEPPLAPFAVALLLVAVTFAAAAAAATIAADPTPTLSSRSRSRFLRSVDVEVGADVLRAKEAAAAAAKSPPNKLRPFTTTRPGTSGLLVDAPAAAAAANVSAIDDMGHKLVTCRPRSK